MKEKTIFSQGTFFHGTKASLNTGDLLKSGFSSNYEKNKIAKYVYFTGTLDAAIWGAELAIGDGEQRIYVVEPQGEFEDDPNLTDKKFPGNPTKSYRTKHSLKVVGEVIGWQGHSPEILKNMLESLKELDKNGVEVIE